MIARKSALVFLNTAVGGVLGLLALHYVTLYLDPATVGGVRYAFGILGILYFVTDLGFGPAHVKRISEGMDEGDCFTTFAAFKLATTAIFLLAAGGILFVTLGLRGTPPTDFRLAAFLLVAFYFTTTAIRSAMQSTFDARLEAARASLVLFAETVVRVALTLVVAFLIAADRGAGPFFGLATADIPLVRLAWQYPDGAFALTWAAAGAFSLAVAVAQWRRSGVRIGRFRPAILRSYWTFALPLFLLGVVGSFSAYVDSVFLGFFWSDTDVALLYPAQQIRTFLEAIPYAAAALLFPTFSAMHARGQHDAMAEKARESLRYIGMITIPIVAFVAAFPRELIHVFLSDRYLPAATALALLAVYSLVMSLMRPYFAIVSGAGRPGVAARVGILMAASNIALNFVLIPADVKSLGLTLAGLKVTGAAIATLASGVLGLAVIVWYSRAIPGGRVLPVGALLRQAGATAAMLLALRAFALVNPFDRWFDFPVFTALGGLVYFGVLALARGFTREDLRFMLGVASVPAMMRYLRSEFARRK